MKPKQLSVQDAIHQYGFPELGLSDQENIVFKDFLKLYGKIRSYQKQENIESTTDGQPMYFILILQGLAHAYYHCPHSQQFWGQYIWYKQECVYLDRKNKDKRQFHIQALEETIVLLIPWDKIPLIQEQLPQIKKLLKKLHRKLRADEQAYHYRNNLPAKANVKLFLERHPSLPHRTSQEICAMHNQMSRHWYSKTYKEIIQQM